MASTTFAAGTVVASTWLNDVNRKTYTEGINVQAYGAVADDATDSLAAFQAAYTAAIAAKAPLLIPGGTYKLSGTWTISDHFARIIPLGNAKLHFTGAGVGLQVAHGAGDAIYQIVIGGAVPLKIRGNATTTDAVDIVGAHHSNINLDVKDCTGKAVRCRWLVCTDLKVESSNNTDGGFTIVPSTGISLEQYALGYYCADLNILNPVIEGVSGTGIDFVSAGFCNLYGGTSEGNAKGMVFAATNAFSNKIYNIDFEANTNVDVEDAGYSNHYYGVQFASNTAANGGFRAMSTCQGAQLFGGYCRWATLDAASLATGFNGVSLALPINYSVGSGPYSSVNSIIVNGSRAYTSKVADCVGEAGTWTPALLSAGGGTQGATTLAVGRYRRVGKWCHLSGTITIAKGTLGAGAVSITGLPFNAVNVANVYQNLCVSEWSNLNLGAGFTHLTMRVSPNTSIATLVKSGNSAVSSTVAVADFPDPVTLIFSGEYETDT